MRSLRVHVLSLTCLLLLSSAVAQSKPSGLTAMDQFNLLVAADPQISPDGKHIVYVREFSDVMTDKRCSNLWIIDVDGRNHRPLTTGVHSDTGPRWSPDGTRLAFLSDQDGQRQLYVRWMDTGQTLRITNVQQPSGIEWSPDGKQISFLAFVPEEPLHLGNVPKPPAGAKWAESPTLYNSLVYRFNGAGYLKPGYTQAFVISAEGGAPRQITGGKFHYGGPGVNASEPTWTPDGKYLLLSANRHPDAEMNPRDTEIYEFSVADGSVKALTDRRGPDGGPAISPDGKLIAYTGEDDRFQGYQVTHLYVMNRDGSKPRSLSDKLDRDARSPRWAPDGSGIYFMYDDNGDTKLGFYSLDGTFKNLASHAPQGGGFSLSRGGVIATLYNLPDRPSDVAVIERAGAEVKPLTELNHDLLLQHHPGQTEEIWYNSSKDGRKIQGWIVKPPDFQPGKKYPLILSIHGGPFANYGDRFDFEKQLWASHGYVVLYTNPRGSTSYGEEFGNLIHHAYPGDDFYDLNSGVDAVIAKGYVDPDNLFVTGGSGGGVLTCWVIGHTTRFRAAASLYPVIDWYSWALTADIPITAVKYWFPGMPWDYPEQYNQRSVISLVKNVKTPTLLMTGEADFRTPISQAEEYYEALKLLQVESVLARVPGEPHGVAQRPSHFITRLMYVLGWFDQHRSGAGSEMRKAAGE